MCQGRRIAALGGRQAGRKVKVDVSEKVTSNWGTCVLVSRINSLT